MLSPRSSALERHLLRFALALAILLLLPAGALQAATQLRIDTTSLPQGSINSYYTTKLAASGGVSPYLWKLRTGSSLPTGISLASDGGIAGTPTSSGDFTLRLEVRDSARGA